jgi:hypothetical protein
MEDKLGSIEIGKKPGLVLIENLWDPHKLTSSSSAKRIL